MHARRLRRLPIFPNFYLSWAMSTIEQQVMLAADALIDAFGRHDRDAYFTAFAPQASFVFHHVAQALPSRDAYERLWRTWEQEEGFCVLACESQDRNVQCLNDDTAIFTHSVRTTVATRDGNEVLDERESIVFARTGRRWLAVHEHLSPMTLKAGGTEVSSC
jgi:SnoaL-like domain